MPNAVNHCSNSASRFKLMVRTSVNVAGGVTVSKNKTPLNGRGLAVFVAALTISAFSATAIAQDACLARCQAQEAQCLQATKGDRATCNAVATQCFQQCRKPR